MLHLLSSDSERRRVTRSAGLALDAGARTSHHQRAPTERGLSSVQCPSKGHVLAANSAAQRARSSKLVCFVSSPETASAGAQAPSGTLRLLGVRGRGLHIVLRARCEGKRPLVSAAPFHRARTGYDKRGMARAQSETDCCAFSPEIASTARLRCARHAALAWRWRPQLARRTTDALRRKETAR